jgi:hypothetical protein
MLLCFKHTVADKIKQHHFNEIYTVKRENLAHTVESLIFVGVNFRGLLEFYRLVGT